LCNFKLKLIGDGRYPNVMRQRHPDKLQTSAEANEDEDHLSLVID
jgi:hypothetical protein